jgi:hypothetical protein
VHLFHAEGPSEAETPAVPFLVLGGAWERGDELPVCDETDELDTELRITATASTVEGASIVLDRVRGHLSPRGSWTPVPMTGRHVAVKREQSGYEPQIDRDLRLPNTNRHPGTGVDLYRLVSTPTEGN